MKLHTIREKLRQRGTLALLAILGLALLLRVALLDRNGLGNPYYAAATYSMLQSVGNFFFVSHDPAGLVSVDKPPVALWIPTLSAKIFGFNGLALLLPQALMGTLCVYLLYRLVRRGFSQRIALGAAFFLAITPIAVAVDRTNNMDTLLTLSLLLSALAVVDAIQRDRLSSLLLAGFWVGVGFNVKMLEAWGVIPAFGLVYLIFSRAPWPRCIGQLALSGVVIVAVSLSWALLVDVISPNNRPHVGGSDKNSAIELALGYNGLGRVFGGDGQIGPGAMGRRKAQGAGRTGGGGSRESGVGSGVNSGMPPMMGGGNGMPGIPPFGGMPGGGPPMMMGGPGGGPGGEGQAGPLRLFRPTLASQSAWFLPLALASLLVVVGGQRSAVSDEIRRAGSLSPADAQHPLPTLDCRLPTAALMALLWGWLLTFWAVFSMAQGIFHSYYLIVLGPPLSALAAVGAAELWKWRAKGAVAAGIGVMAVWEAYLLRDYGWIPDVALVMGTTVFIALGFLTLSPKTTRPMTRLCGGLLLVAPIVWAITPLFMPMMGPMPSAGPMPNMTRMMERMRGSGVGGQGSGFPGMPPGMGGPGVAGMPPFPSGLGGGMPPFGGRGMRGGMPGMPGAEADAKMTAFLKAHNGGERVLLLTQSAMEASPYIIAGLKVASFGGFLGRDPVLTPERLQKMAQSGEARFVMVSERDPGMMAMRGGLANGDPNKTLKEWITANGTPVSETLWRDSTSGGFPPMMMGPPGMEGRGTLYDLRPDAKPHQAEATKKPTKPV